MSVPVVWEESRTAAVAAGATRVLDRCRVIARCTEKPGEILRTFLSPAMDEVHQVMRPWMETAGITCTVDQAGNLRGLAAPQSGEAAPRLLIGSHLDTVPNAGAYDGVLGVLMGLALVEATRGRRFPFAVEVIGFSDEEGTRFGVPFLGSRAVVGELQGERLESVDCAGISIAEALRDFAVRRPQTIAPQLSPHSSAYLEFHIEQGPVLESRNLPLGIVEGLAGQSRSHIVFRGRAGHAGTTPMALRHDALAAAAEWMMRVEAIARQSENAVATIGQIAADPGGVNVIPGEARCSLDVRHVNNSVRDELVRVLFGEARTIATRRGVSAETAEYHSQSAVHLDPGMVRLAERAAEQAGYPAIRMTSGAGHDAMIIAPHVPSAMVFLRNPGGISHHPDESVAEADVAAALRTGLQFLEEFAAYVSGKGSHSGA